MNIEQITSACLPSPQSFQNTRSDATAGAGVFSYNGPLADNSSGTLPAGVDANRRRSVFSWTFQGRSTVPSVSR